jgi:hypothetical protein
MLEILWREHGDGGTKVINKAKQACKKLTGIQKQKTNVEL